jgi:SAM-dependent methyltransferase
MEQSAYIQMKEKESLHWWFVARRLILSSVISKLNLPARARILEVGCGSGGNLKMLACFGEVYAFEMNPLARKYAEDLKCAEIEFGCCPDQIPFQNLRFDLICIFDVLEHIDRDLDTLTMLKKLLANNGSIVISVPSYEWLYGPHDKFLHHKRRYSKRGLINIIFAARLKAIKLSYFNSFLFPLALVVRVKDRIIGHSATTALNLPRFFLNEILKNIFSFERFLLQHLNLPLGLSLVGVLKATDDSL